MDLTEKAPGLVNAVPSSLYKVSHTVLSLEWKAGLLSPVCARSPSNEEVM